MMTENITEFRYANTNTYLIRGSRGGLLFDTGWAGTFPLLCRALGGAGRTIQEISHLLISHYHPDHMGIAQEIASQGVQIVVPDIQRKYIHSSDTVFAKEKNTSFTPILDSGILVIPIRESRDFLAKLGICGEIFYTPGHSDDSISLWLDEGTLFVGDLNPLYELELHKGTPIGDTWRDLLALRPSRIYYGHAKSTVLDENECDSKTPGRQTAASRKQRTARSAIRPFVQEGTPATATKQPQELYSLIKRITRYIDRGYPLEQIQKKTKADGEFIEKVTRMYLTHQDIGVQGILDRIE